jgi:hypothetical protein
LAQKVCFFFAELDILDPSVVELLVSHIVAGDGSGPKFSNFVKGTKSRRLQFVQERKERMLFRVARFFLVHDTKTGKNVPN